jgi:hypothetical protein
LAAEEHHLLAMIQETPAHWASTPRAGLERMAQPLALHWLQQGTQTNFSLVS